MVSLQIKKIFFLKKHALTLPLVTKQQAKTQTIFQSIDSPTTLNFLSSPHNGSFPPYSFHNYSLSPTKKHLKSSMRWEVFGRRHRSSTGHLHRLFIHHETNGFTPILSNMKTRSMVARLRKRRKWMWGAQKSCLPWWLFEKRFWGRVEKGTQEKERVLKSLKVIDSRLNKDFWWVLVLSSRVIFIIF